MYVDMGARHMTGAALRLHVAQQARAAAAPVMICSAFMQEGEYAILQALVAAGARDGVTGELTRAVIVPGRQTFTSFTYIYFSRPRQYEHRCTVTLAAAFAAVGSRVPSLSISCLKYERICSKAQHD